jgi:hypothetical protein
MAASVSNKDHQVSSILSTNPFIDNFIDCIENIPNKLQLLFTELRAVDAQVNCKLNYFIFFKFFLYKT